MPEILKELIKLIRTVNEVLVKHQFNINFLQHLFMELCRLQEVTQAIYNDSAEIEDKIKESFNIEYSSLLNNFYNIQNTYAQQGVHINLEVNIPSPLSTVHEASDEEDSYEESSAAALPEMMNDIHEEEASAAYYEEENSLAEVAAHLTRIPPMSPVAVARITQESLVGLCGNSNASPVVVRGFLNMVDNPNEEAASAQEVNRDLPSYLSQSGGSNLPFSPLVGEGISDIYF